MSADEITASGGSSIELWLSGSEECIAQAELQRRVWEELTREAPLAGADLQVEVTDRVAILDGVVDSYLHKAAAGRAARRVSGICAVENRIRVELPPSQIQTDVDLTIAATRALESSGLVPLERITVRVEAGRVTLEGLVRRYAKRIAAADAVSPLPGVRDLLNRLTVDRSLPCELLETRLQESLQQVHARRIKCETRGDSVILHGRVRSLAERDRVESAVWAVPGVAALTDDIEIAP